MNTHPDLEIEFWKKEAQKWKNLALRLMLSQSHPPRTPHDYNRREEDEQGV